MLTVIVGDIRRYIAYFGTAPKLVIGKFTLDTIEKYDDDLCNKKQQTIAGCKFEEGDFLWGYYLKKFDL